MRCQVCDEILKDWEEVKKDPDTGEYLDTCNQCLSAIGKAVNELENEDVYYHDVDTLLSDSFDVNDFLVDKRD